MNRLLWPGMLFFLIGSIVAVNVVMLVVASRDPSFAVAPDYHKGGDNLAEIRQQHVNRDLGWSVSLTCELADSENATLDVRLDDAVGAPIEGATVSVRAFHQARAAKATIIRLVQRSPGVYVGVLAVDRTGHWRCIVTAEHEDSQFVDAFPAYLSETSSAGDGS